MKHERVERHLSAILIADVVGYSRLTGEDEVGTLRRIKALRKAVLAPCVDGHGGRIVSTRGDGFLVEFPSAVEAVRCGVQVQQATAALNADTAPSRRLELRIGINLGDIIVDGRDVHGDGVNVAARLEPLAEAGGICISGTVYEHVRGKLDYPFADRGEKTVKNIAQPVHIFALDRQAIEALPHSDEPVGRPAARSKAAGAGAVAAAVVLSVGAWTLWPTPKVPEPAVPTAASNAPVTTALNRRGLSGAQPGAPPPLSVVVLPFTNTRNDPDEEYFADGITQDLTTDLSRIPGAFIIAPTTAFTYKQKPIDVRQVGRELSVRYVLSGDVRRIGQPLRINARLVDAERASQVWAERFDGDVGQLAKLQDDVTRRIAGAMNVALVEAESQRSIRERPEHPDAVDLSMRGWALLNQPPSRKTTQESRDLFERALQLDANYLPALNGLSQVLVNEWGSTWYARSGEETLKELESVVNRALAINPRDALATHFHSYVLKRLYGNLAQALAAAQRAVELDPNLAVAHNTIAQLKVFSGRADDGAAEDTLTAIRLSPRDPLMAQWCYQLGITYIHQGRDSDAVAWAREGTQRNPNLRFPYRVLAAALALSGNVDEARRVAAEMLRRYPKETISAFRVREPWTDPAYVAGQEREIAGMRLAGIPE